MRISHRDLELLQGATLDLHKPHDLAGLRREAPAIFKRVIPADFFVWRETGRSRLYELDGDAVLWESPRRSKPGMLRKMLSVTGQHPFTLHAIRTGNLGPHRLSDFWTAKQQRESPVQRELYDRLGVWRYLATAIVRADRAGAVGLGRPRGSRDFTERDREMLRLLSPHFAQALTAASLATARNKAEADATSRLGLSPREAAVAGWLARGRTNPEIAVILAMKPRTVEKHVENILAKLGVENRTAAAAVILGSATVRAVTGRTAGGARARQAIRRIFQASQPRPR